MLRYFLIFIGILTKQLIFAQVSFSENLVQGSNRPELLKDIEIHQDPMVGKMLDWHIENNKIKNKIEGFRVEIFFSSDVDAKEKALKKKVEFLSAYPDNTVHIIYVSPNFRVRVGDFRTKNEALKLYREIKDNYPVSFIITDEIDFPLMKQVQYE
ncbi:hypothetical protein MASR2M47_38430 [Draconibacterium sp.]